MSRRNNSAGAVDFRASPNRKDNDNAGSAGRLRPDRQVRRVQHHRNRAGGLGHCADGAHLSRYTPRTANYWRLTAIVKREEPVCWLCGKEIEAWRRKPDPLAFQCDHVEPARSHPELAEVRSNLRASHARCNRDRERTKTPSPTQLGVYVSVDDF